MKIKFYAIAIGLIIGMTSPVFGLGEQVTLPVKEDSMAVGSPGGENFGSSPSMFLEHQNSTWGNKFSLAKFDLSAIPANAVILRARLRFYTGVDKWPGYSSNFVPIAIFRNLSDWAEDSVTFNLAPEHDVEPVASTGQFLDQTDFTQGDSLSSDSEGWLEFSGSALANLVQDWVDEKESNFGVTVKAIGHSLPDGRIFSLKTKEHPAKQTHPHLLLDYTLGEKTDASFSTTSIQLTTNSTSIPEASVFSAKAQRGDPITVIFFGGSITRGATTYPTFGTDAEGIPYDYSSYDTETDSWRARTFEWLRSQYEQTPGQFRQRNAAIGGTPSLLGAYRLEQDVLSKNPDLVFVEFAVNDHGAGAKTEENPSCSGSILRTCRSIVDRLRAHNPDVLIFMPLSTHRILDGSAHSSWSEGLNLGHDQTRRAADILKVPYVSMKDAFNAQRGAGRDFFFGGPDTAANFVHPAPAGHAAYAEAVQTALKKLFESGSFSFHKDVSTVEPYPVVPTLILPRDLAASAPGWVVEVPESVESPILEGHACLVSNADSEALDYTFFGTAVGLWIDTTSAGCMDVHLDGNFVGRYANQLPGPNAFSGRFSSLAEDLSLGSHTLRLDPVPAANGAPPQMKIRAVAVDKGRMSVGDSR